ncbi:hypothetical protein C5F47_00800 [Nitrosopumilus cobalaminigenes]|uniref:RmlD-like substrate binding domain-containing protein n=1 Tax=Nitrosopumilus cobalaminigenes TaxID=1470066 RepID=A0A7D5R6K1_9ARCH|nr:SDR family oxidoreductase [Nitrosopumilus cobalaminigenes]QLH02221.1 hypothetical protein C5F47_00800 [Nitrosopumilus cobalaminigenes]
MKIAIIGASGLLGEGFLHLKTKHKLITTVFSKDSINNSTVLDIRKYNDVKKFVDEFKPDVVINTSAITNPEYCEINPIEANQTNVMGVKNLAEICNNFKIHFIQISTEYVFDGITGKYQEESIPNPISKYGESKLESEKITLQINNSFCVARTAMLFGWSKNKLNLATLLISKLSQGEKLDVIKDQIVSPSYNDNIAEILLELAEKKLSGIYHVSGSDIMSRLEFAKALAKEFKFDEKLLESISISEFNWKAKRPKNGGLEIDKISKILHTKPMSVSESLKQMKIDSIVKM